jgi:hypothetical protein
MDRFSQVLQSVSAITVLPEAGPKLIESQQVLLRDCHEKLLDSYIKRHFFADRLQ